MTTHEYDVEVVIRKHYLFQSTDPDPEAGNRQVDEMIRKDFPGLTRWSAKNEGHSTAPEGDRP